MIKLVKIFLRKAGYKLVRYESLQYNKRALDFYDVMKAINSKLVENSITGVFVECGFGYGRSFAVMSHFSQQSNRKIYGIDSFQGFPSIHAFDKSHRNAKKNEWSVINLHEANRMVKNLGLFDANKNCELIKLVFDSKTINPIPKEKIALLHIDLDLYEGYKYSLEIFWDQIQTGGIILFDEYNEIEWPGATKAVNDFLHKHSLTKQIRVIAGKYCLIKE